MSYLEIVKRALKERSVNQAAKDWGISQPTLDRYTKAKHLPDYLTAKKMAIDAGITAEEMFDALIEEEMKVKAKKTTKMERISKSFNFLLRAANVGRTRVPTTA
jgi:hypothetical protein